LGPLLAWGPRPWLACAPRPCPPRPGPPRPGPPRPGPPRPGLPRPGSPRPWASRLGGCLTAGGFRVGSGPPAKEGAPSPLGCLEPFSRPPWEPRRPPRPPDGPPGRSAPPRPGEGATGAIGAGRGFKTGRGARVGLLASFGASLSSPSALTSQRRPRRGGAGNLATPDPMPADRALVAAVQLLRSESISDRVATVCDKSARCGNPGFQHSDAATLRVPTPLQSAHGAGYGT